MDHVLIIGAGPGGAVAALALARQGIKSTVIDKAQFPRQKPCGDVITSQTLRALERVGLNPTADLPLIKGQATWGTTCIAPNGKGVDVDFKPLKPGTNVPSCYTLQRASFDNYLVDQLRKHDLISLLEGVSVTKLERVNQQWMVSTSQDHATKTFNYIIVANGCNSPIAKQLTETYWPRHHGAFDNDRHFGVGLRGYFQDRGGWRKSGMPEFYIIRELMPGGIYLTPLANGLVNVNVVMRRDYVKAHGINLQERFWQVIANHPTLAKRFGPESLVGNLQGSSLSFGTIKRPVSGPGYLLVGDAAGLIDLLSANGICNAVASAELAAEVLAKSIASGDDNSLQQYDVLLDQKLGNELKLGRLVSPFLGNERLFGLFEWVLNFVASRVQGGTTLSQLLYHPDVGKLLRSPQFYRQLVFG